MDICQIATKVISGEQALSAFQVYRTERIFILCDGFLTRSGAIDFLTRQIAPTNQVQIFDDVVPDPHLHGVAKALAAAVDFQPTVLVAFGGGAAIDTAKALVYFASGAHAFSRPPVFIVIPTTSGTGSERHPLPSSPTPKKSGKSPSSTMSCMPMWPFWTRS